MGVLEGSLYKVAQERGDCDMNCPTVAFDEIFHWRKFPAIRQQKTHPTFKNTSGAFPRRISSPNLVCASVQAVPLRISGWFFYFQPGSRDTGVQLCPQHSTSRNQKSTSQTLESLLWWAKPLKTKLICENKQRVGRVRSIVNYDKTYGIFLRGFDQHLCS